MASSVWHMTEQFVHLSLCCSQTYRISQKPFKFSELRRVYGSKIHTDTKPTADLIVFQLRVDVITKLWTVLGIIHFVLVDMVVRKWTGRLYNKMRTVCHRVAMQWMVIKNRALCDCKLHHRLKQEFWNQTTQFVFGQLKYSRN